MSWMIWIYERSGDKSLTYELEYVKSEERIRDRYSIFGFYRKKAAAQALVDATVRFLGDMSGVGYLGLLHYLDIMQLVDLISATFGEDPDLSDIVVAACYVFHDADAIDVVDDAPTRG